MKKGNYMRNSLVIHSIGFAFMFAISISTTQTYAQYERVEPITQSEYKERAHKILKFNADRDQWVGKSVDDLALAWGGPTDTYNRADGGRHVTYRERTYYKYSMLGSVSRYCDTLFVSNAKGIIQSWQASGSCDTLESMKQELKNRYN